MTDFQHAKIIEQVEQGILQVAEQREKALDAKLKAFDQMGKVISCL
jgi:hypothetical protein